MKKFISLLLTAVLLLSCCGASAETIKHERVFAVLAADGMPATVLEHVRLENADGLQEIADETTLTEIENISGMESFTLTDGALIWKAMGNDITYRGKSEKTLPATPVVTYELDGQAIAAEDVKEAVGELLITIAFTQEAAAPLFAISCLPVPEGASDITAEHAVLVSEAGKQFVIGWAVPGADEALGLPTSFTVACHVDHAAFEQMLTIETAQPLEKLLQESEDKIADADSLHHDAVALLTAIQAGEPLPEVSDALKELTQPITQLMDGVAQLDEGASQLYDGAVALDGGIAALNEGLQTLTASNDALNAGAAQIFAAILKTANTQLASAGLDALGIAIPELTSDNYAAVLDAAIAQLSDAEALKAMLEQGARAKVSAAIEENDEQIRAAVTQAVQAQVLEAVLTQLQMPMTAEEYAAAMAAKQVPAETDAQLQAAVAQQMADEIILAKLEAAVAAQKEALLAQNLESQEVQAQLESALAAAQAGTKTLSELKASLDGVNTFVAGLTKYTGDVSQVTGGASQLVAGSAALKDGALALRDGVTTLHTSLTDGEKTLADQYLPKLTGEAADVLSAIHAMEETTSEPLRYDAIPVGMTHDLCVIVRTEMGQ